MKRKMNLKIVIFIFICVILFCCFARFRVCDHFDKWEIVKSKDNNVLFILIGSSLSKRSHSYQRVGNDIYVKVYNGLYTCLIYDDVGALYRFVIPEPWDEIENIYSYDKYGKPVKIFSSLENERQNEM